MSLLACPVALGTTCYKGDKVYTDMKNRLFRVICDSNEPSKERRLRWEGAQPSCDEWHQALAYIAG